ncbi:hypothetical protein [Edaphobacter aggregans]|uniref:hypothetical protein n=1 Tax=Edaphobacter aggregans TaxID=570835 RepID=UPI00054DDB3C|nr:hypothetical protein [Edaphobacter aggregans]
MPIAIVILNKGPDAPDINDLRADSWWNSYFFDPVDGQCAYWLKQTDNQMKLTGATVGWLAVSLTDEQRKDRTKAAQALVDWMIANHNVGFDRIDIVICIHGLGATVESDGGGTHEVIVDGRKLPAVVGRLGDGFDFYSHEIGHAFGLDHSFGKEPIVVVGDAPGGYGHPHCIMSAQLYGSDPDGGACFPALPKDGSADYSSIGPSVNAVTALNRGWLDATQFLVAENQMGEFEIRSRHQGGRNPGLPPQALHVVLPNGSDYCVEYREARDWDQGQTGDRVIVTQDKGGLGDGAYPDKHVGSFAWATGGLYDVHVFDGFELQVLEKLLQNHSVRVRIIRGHSQYLTVNDSCVVKTIKRIPIESGTTDFEPGDLRCVRGSWPYSREELIQQAVIEITYANPPGLDVGWTVEGQTLPQPSDTLTFPSKYVYFTNPKLRTYHSHEDVVMKYTIDTLANGSRLTLISAPPNKNFTLQVDANALNIIGRVNRSYTVELKGLVYEYGGIFESKRIECMANLANPSSYFPTYEVIVVDPPKFWRKVPKERRDEVVRHLSILEHLRSEGETDDLQRALQEFEAMSFGAAADLQFRPVRHLTAAEISNMSSCQLQPPPARMLRRLRSD